MSYPFDQARAPARAFRLPPGFEPTGIQHLLRYRPIAAALQKPVLINNRYCVPYGAGRSSDDRETYVDKHMGEFHHGFNDFHGRPLSLWRFADAHEKVELAAMEHLKKSYREAHGKFAIPIEKWLVQANGGDWALYQHLWAHMTHAVGHEHSPLPPHLYLGPYTPYERKRMMARGVQRPGG